MKKIYELPSDTTQKVQTALKEAFPDAIFSIRTRHPDTVLVEWTDGPMKNEVEAVLNLFRSYVSDGKNPPSWTEVGYLYNGQLIVGAKKLTAIRVLSIQRTAQILAVLKKLNVPESEARPRDYAFAELLLIEQRNIPKNGAATNRRDNLVYLPMDPILIKAKHFIEGLSDREWYRLQLMHSIYGRDVLTILADGASIDDLFVILIQDLERGAEDASRANGNTTLSEE